MRFKRTMDQAAEVWERVQIYRAQHPRATWPEIYRAVPSHYGHHESLRSSMRRLEREQRGEQRDMEEIVSCWAVCEECHAFAVTDRWRGRRLCGACLNAPLPPMQLEEWLAQHPQESTLATAQRRQGFRMSQRFIWQVDRAYARLVRELGCQDLHPWHKSEAQAVARKNVDEREDTCQRTR